MVKKLYKGGNELEKLRQEVSNLNTINSLNILLIKERDEAKEIVNVLKKRIEIIKNRMDELTKLELPTKRGSRFTIRKIPSVKTETKTSRSTRRSRESRSPVGKV